MKDIYHDYFSYLMDEKATARKMAREFWNELDDTLPFGASLQQEVPNWPWATKIVVGTTLQCICAQFLPVFFFFFFFFFFEEGNMPIASG